MDRKPRVCWHISAAKGSVSSIKSRRGRSLLTPSFSLFKLALLLLVYPDMLGLRPLVLAFTEGLGAPAPPVAAILFDKQIDKLDSLAMCKKQL